MTSRLGGLLLAALMLPGRASAAETRTVRTADLEIQVGDSDPDPPRVGENRLAIALRDLDGRAIDGAALALAVRMPAMGAMAEMRGGGTVTAQGGGRYAVTYALPMGGDWFLTLAIDPPGRPHREIRMKIATGRPGVMLEDDAAGAPGGVHVSLERQQRIGVTFAPVARRPLSQAVRAAGRVAVDELSVADVTLKYEAYVQKLFAAATGQRVRRGQPLAIVYSPDLLSAEQELLAARRAGTPAPLSAGLEQRLASWDLTPAQIQAVEKAGKADGRVTIASPAAGAVLEKNVVEGSRVAAGTTLYRVGNLGRVWIQAAVSERDAALISVGQPARVRPGTAAPPLAARVTFVAPTVDDRTRTIAARLELANPGLALKPGMFVDVTVDVPLGTRLAVPDAALLLSGEHRYAFVDRGGGRLQPVEVSIGAAAGDYVEVRGGLSEGDRVATGATFLLSSEAKLRDALPRWTTP